MSDDERYEKEHVSLCEALDRVLNKGAVIVGDVMISVADIPTTTTPSNSSSVVSWIVFTNPVRSANIAARASAENGNLPTRMRSLPYWSMASCSVRPTAAISGSVLIQRGTAPVTEIAWPAMFSAAISPSRNAVWASCQYPATSPTA